MKFVVHPLTVERWSDFVSLFGTRGACGGCWCMTWRRPRGEFEAGKGAGNRRAMQTRVRAGRVPGVIGYLDGEPVAWCSVEPREQFVSLGRSRVLAPVDDQPVWSVSCLFIARAHRGQGLATKIVAGAVDWARSQGATLVEAYPVEPRQTLPAPFVWTGLPSPFLKAGFREVARRSPTRPLLRRAIRPAGR